MTHSSAGTPSARDDGLPTIDLEDLVEAVRAGAVTLVEALGAAFYAEAHLPGAVNLTPERFATHATSLLTDRSAQIVVYGSVTSPSSGYVTRMLLGLGYHRVRHYPGGKEEWAERGLPLQRGA